MAEFYVTYDWRGEHYLAIVVAPRQPEKWQFATVDELQAEMDSLGHDWEVHCQIVVPRDLTSDDEWATWRKRLAEERVLRKPWRPDKYLAGQGGGSALP